MGNHGARVVRFRLLRQPTHSLSYGKTMYSEYGPQEPRLSREFFDSKVDPLERSYFQSSVFSSITSRALQNGVADGLTRVMSLSSVEILTLKRHMFVEDHIPSHFSVWRGRDDGSRNPRRH